MVLTYGCRRAMGGNCIEAIAGGWFSCLRRGLAPFLLISLAIHGACFIFYSAGAGFRTAGTATVPGGRVVHLQVNLASRRNTAVDVPGPLGALGERRVGVRTAGEPRGAANLRVAPDTAPELVSEIGDEIDDSRATGFMIIALEVDDQGVPGKAEVIYSDLPPEIAELLIRRFAAARFRPAMKGGEATAASILMRIDVQ